MTWMTLLIGGQRWSVRVVSRRHPALNENGEKYDGRCRFDTCRIYINRDLSEIEQVEVLFHEIVHAWVRRSGVWEILVDGLGEKDAGRYDEMLVSAGSPVLLGLFLDLGFSFPKVNQ